MRFALQGYSALEDGDFPIAVLFGLGFLAVGGGKDELEKLPRGFLHGDALQKLAAAYLPAAGVEILRDLGGNDRVTKITLPTP